jgi:hypothetical protein
MRKKQLGHRIKALDLEKKVLSATSMLAIVACFLPWYGINSRVIANGWWNAFGSIGSVAGYVVTLFALATLGIISLQVLKPEWNIQQKLMFKESSILLFLSAQSFFVTLLFIPVYSQYSLINASSSGTRFGIYIALISALISAITAFAYQKRTEKTASMQAGFASVPRTHRAVDEWGQTETETVEEEVGQETMFDQYAEPQQYAEMTDQPSENEYHQMK